MGLQKIRVLRGGRWGPVLSWCPDIQVMNSQDPQLNEVLSEEIYALIKPALEAMFQEEGIPQDDIL